MKLSILIHWVFIFLAGSSLLTACRTAAQRVEKAEDNVVEAKKDLEKVQEAYLADIENYRRETAVKIAANEERIAALNAKTESERKEARAEYKKKVTTLEQRNTNMKKKLDNYKAEGKDKWERFKTDFNREMDDLGNAFKNMIGTNKEQ